MNNLRSGIFSTLVTNLAVLCLGLASSILLARYLEPSGRGLYALLATFLSFATYWSTLGIGQATLREMALNRYEKKFLLGDALFWLAVQSVLGMGVLYAWLHLHPDNFLQASASAVLIMFLAVPAQHLYGMATYILLGLQRFDLYNRTVLLRSVIGLIALGILAYLDFEVLGALFADLAGYGAACIVIICMLYKIVGRPYVALSKDRLQSSLIFGLPVFVSTALMLLHNRADLLILGKFDSIERIGLYIVAAGLSERMLMLPNAIATVLFPHQAFTSSASNDPSLGHIPRIFRFTGISMILVAAMLSLLAKPLIVLLFSEQYSEAASVLPPLLFGATSLGLYGIIESDLKSRGNTLSLMCFNFIAVVMNIILNFLLVPTFGIAGAATASFISYSTLSVLGLIGYLTRTGASLKDLVIPDREDARILIQGIRRR